MYFIIMEIIDRLIAMKILILTTQTTHHTKYVQAIVEHYPETKVVVETKVLEPKFVTFHDYLDDQNQYEQDLWFDGKNPKIDNFAETHIVHDANDLTVQEMIKNFAPDLAVVFGTGKIRPSIIELIPERILNLHGGDPEEYRGLDTHLWAIYHGEFNQLITCLHKVAPDLDTGDIVSKGQLTLAKNMRLHQLRAINTQVCIDLTLDAIKELKKNGAIKFSPQKKKGRYYSYMPSVLKTLCVEKFERYCRDLA